MLKNSLVGFLLALFSGILSAQNFENHPLISDKFQHAVNYSFAVAHISQNHSLVYMPYWGAHSFRVGFRFNINNYDYFMNYPAGMVTYQRGYAANFREKIGFNLGYQYNFKIKNSPFFAPYAFYDAEISHIGTRFQIQTYNIQTSPATRIDAVIINPPTWINVHTIGLGLKFKMYKNFSFDLCAGVGILLYKPFATIFSDRSNHRRGNWEMVGLDGLPLMRMGVSYVLPNFNPKH